jgi:ankyrin repeat protein
MAQSVRLFRELTNISEDETGAETARKYILRARGVLELAVSLYFDEIKQQELLSSPGEQLLNGVRCANLGFVQSMLRSDAKLIAYKDKSDMTPLLHAAKSGHSNIVRVLVEHGATVNEVGGSFAESALHWAALMGHVDTVKTLLALTADVNLRSRVARSPLHMACQSARADVIDLLLAAGASPSAVDRDLSTPAHHLAEFVDVDTVAACIRGMSSLAKSGANFSLTDIKGRTPLDVVANAELKAHMLTLRTSGSAANARPRPSGPPPLSPRTVRREPDTSDATYACCLCTHCVLISFYVCRQPTNDAARRGFATLPPKAAAAAAAAVPGGGISSDTMSPRSTRPLPQPTPRPTTATMSTTAHAPPPAAATSASSSSTAHGSPAPTSPRSASASAGMKAPTAAAAAAAAATTTTSNANAATGAVSPRLLAMSAAPSTTAPPRSPVTSPRVPARAAVAAATGAGGVLGQGRAFSPVPGRGAPSPIAQRTPSEVFANHPSEVFDDMARRPAVVYERLPRNPVVYEQLPPASASATTSTLLTTSAVMPSAPTAPTTTTTTFGVTLTAGELGLMIGSMSMTISATSSAAAAAASAPSVLARERSASGERTSPLSSPRTGAASATSIATPPTLAHTAPSDALPPMGSPTLRNAGDAAARVAAQEEQLQVVLAHKREMEERRRTVYLLEQRRRDQPVQVVGAGSGSLRWGCCVVSAHTVNHIVTQHQQCLTTNVTTRTVTCRRRTARACEPTARRLRGHGG